MKIFVGYDPRESIAYHTFCNSVIRHATKPVSFTPLALNTLGYKEEHTDGSNQFIYSRFLVPYLNNYQGWALYVDGDMICNDDIKNLFDLIDESKAVMVVKHNYKTKFPRKYLGNKNEDYPRKNWSSVILWNCGHMANRIITPTLIRDTTTETTQHLHRFQWLQDEAIGELPTYWNWLTSELSHNDSASLYHYTVGTPCFPEYADSDHSGLWWDEYYLTTNPVRTL